MHRYHPDPNNLSDNPDAIYYDDCEDCEHHARETPFNADHYTAKDLWNQMLAVELGDDSYRSGNEAIAGHLLWRTYIFLERFTIIDPKNLTFKQ